MDTFYSPLLARLSNLDACHISSSVVDDDTKGNKYLMPLSERWHGGSACKITKRTYEMKELRLKIDSKTRLNDVIVLKGLTSFTNVITLSLLLRFLRHKKCVLY